MAARGVLRILDRGQVGFHCPGCHEIHQITVDRPAGTTGPTWSFNGDYDKPTFTPSILVRSVQCEHDEAGEWTGEWKRDAQGKALPSICHSFVTDGKIQFLGDCTHELAGQTVDLSPAGE